MWTKIVETGRFGDSLWLVTPDHPEELPVVWLVMGQTPDQPHSITIPVKREHIPALVKALSLLEVKPT